MAEPAPVQLACFIKLDLKPLLHHQSFPCLYTKRDNNNLFMLHSIYITHVGTHEKTYLSVPVCVYLLIVAVFSHKTRLLTDL